MPLRLAAPPPEPQPAPPIRGIDSRIAAAQVLRQEMILAGWHSPTRPLLDGILRRAETPRVYPMAEGAHAGAVGGAAAAKGKALRVSLAAGFRIPEWKLRPIAFPAPSPAGLLWPGLRPLPCQPHGPVAEAAAAASPAVAPAMPEMRIPAAPLPAERPAGRGGFRWPQAMDLSGEFANSAALHRLAVVAFTSSEEYSGKERPYEYRN